MKDPHIAPGLQAAQHALRKDLVSDSLGKRVIFYSSYVNFLMNTFFPVGTSTRQGATGAKKHP